MNDDLIKRSDAIEALGEEPYVWTDDDEFAQGERSQWIDDVSAIKAVPSADRPQGEWKHLSGDEWLCSNCGYVVWTEGSWEHPLERRKDYCEHCGARMKEGKGE